MASENSALVSAQRMDNGLNAAQLLFHNDSSRFGCSGAGGNRVIGGDSAAPKTRELGGFIDDKLLTTGQGRYLASQGEFRRNIFPGEASERREDLGGRNWSGSGATSTDTEGDELDDEDDEDDDVDEGEGNAEGPVKNCVDGYGGRMNSSGDVVGKIIVGNLKGSPIFGQQGAGPNQANASDMNQQRRMEPFPIEVGVAEPNGGMCYSHFVRSAEGRSSGNKDVSGDNGCGFSGRKDSSTSSDPGESLRAIFSDPITGTIMDDAMILPCGHSFGGGGIQQVIRMKACYTCSQPVTEDLVSPNLSLRAAVQAFQREEEQMHRSSKRRRERLDQEKGNFSDPGFMGTGVQFPFAVSDRVIIKGNKRTPQRFVGREAVVTAQCLNGWYVVKTLDNAESVKLQYRSLAKAPENSPFRAFPDGSKFLVHPF